MRSSGSLSSSHFLPTFRVYLSVPYSYRCFGTTQSVPTNPWDRYVVPKRRYEITITRCVITQKSAILSYFAAEAWNNASVIPLHWFFFGLCFTFLFLFWFSIQEGIIWSTPFVFVVNVWHAFAFISFPSAWRAVCLSVLPGLTIYMNRKTQSRKLYNSTVHCLLLSRLKTSDDNLNMFFP